MTFSLFISPLTCYVEKWLGMYGPSASSLPSDCISVAKPFRRGYFELGWLRNALLCERFKFVGRKARGEILGDVLGWPFFQWVWVERRRRLFEDVKGKKVDHLCESFWLWPFKGIGIFGIQGQYSATLSLESYQSFLFDVFPFSFLFVVSLAL